MTKIQNCRSLVIGIWILFVICHLVLGACILLAHELH